MTSSRITTQVLEAATGVPAEGMHVELSGRDGAAWRVLAEATTDVDGRVVVGA